MAKTISSHSTPESAVAMATVAIPVAPPLSVGLIRPICLYGLAVNIRDLCLSSAQKTWYVINIQYNFILRSLVDSRYSAWNYRSKGRMSEMHFRNTPGAHVITADIVPYCLSNAIKSLASCVCLSVCLRVRTGLWGRISRKRLEIETWYQRSTNRKRLMGNRLVTWPMTSRDLERSRSWPNYL